MDFQGLLHGMQQRMSLLGNQSSQGLMSQQPPNYSAEPMSYDETVAKDQAIMSQNHAPEGYEPPTNEEKASYALNKHFPNNPEMQSVMMSQFANETWGASFDPKEVERGGARHKGIGLMQFTDMNDEYPKDSNGNKTSEHQRTGFMNWIWDNGRDLDADSTVEYIKLLITADSKWAKKYHDIGAGNRKKGRKLMSDGASVSELSDFVTENVVGPFSRDSPARRDEKAERRMDAVSQHTGRPPMPMAFKDSATGWGDGLVRPGSQNLIR
tara:strand:+ start:67 stop:870 length:804 start_codon:yes stop_codon:yes gene_type:complete